jgi:SAM-dependent methyltransferase
MLKRALLTTSLTWLAGCAELAILKGPTEEHPHQKGGNSFTFITGSDVDEERERWNELFRKQKYFTGKEPLETLRANVDRLPRGRALVLPMEEGRNAVFLARNGYDVTGIDYSDDALLNARNLARENRVKIHGINADLNHYQVDRGSYDVIVACEFYRPRLVELIKTGLRRGGVLVYEAYTLDHRKNKIGRRDYLLKPGQLKALFSDFEILSYAETNDGRRAVASLVAMKR